jgi:transcriptional antiterminator NusG
MSTENVSSEDQPEVAEEAGSVADDVASAGDVGGVAEQSVVEPVGDAVESEIEEELNEFGFSADEMVTDEDLEEDDSVAEASPIEELVEETVHGEVDESEMDWYILKVQVNREKSICENLRRNVKRAGMEGYFQDLLVPTEDVREFTKAGKQRVVKRKLYPGYIVVRMAINDDSWFLVRETSGIGDFTGSAGKPAPLSAEEIDRIISTTRPVEDEESEEKIKTAIPFKEGDRVRVKEGYFQNYEGDVSAVDERNGRITVMIDIFGRPNPVELDHWHVESVA